MRLVIVTGLSGAGKSTALKMLEDARYFCVDNLPIPLMSKFVSLMAGMQGEDVQNAAIGIDARSGRDLRELEKVLEQLGEAGYEFEILFLDADDRVLVKRYKESRRSHPLAMYGRVDEGIHREREKMKFLKERADYIIDTSHLLTRELKKEIFEIFDIIKKYGACLATGHLDTKEAYLLCKTGRKHGVNMILTHPEWNRTKSSGAIQKELADTGVLIEKNWLNIAEGSVSAEEMASNIRNSGVNHVYLSTDRGQAGFEHPVEGMLCFIETLLAQGFSEKEIKTMLCTVPGFIVSRNTTG